MPVNTFDDWYFFGVRKYSDTKKLIIFFQIKCSDSKKIIILISPNIYGKYKIMAKFHINKTDLVNCTHSREEKPPSYR